MSANDTVIAIWFAVTILAFIGAFVAIGVALFDLWKRSRLIAPVANWRDRKSSPSALPFGSNEEFSASDDPHCHDGGEACIDCLMRGECILFVCQTALPTDKN